MIIVSSDYVAKPWTNLERQNAISQFIQRRGEYILCLKVDNTDLPGFPAVIGYASLSRHGEDGIYKLILNKLGPPNHEGQLSYLEPGDVALVGQILQACFRRALYTRMDSEIHMGAMYNSIGAALGAVQRITPLIQDQGLQFACGEIIRALDDVERTRLTSSGVHSGRLTPEVRSEIDQNKQKVVRLLLELRRAAAIPMQLPFALQTDHFWGADEANEPPKKWRS